MREAFKVGLAICTVMIVIALGFLVFNVNAPETIKSDVFEIEKWNDTEYIENNVFSIKDGVVLKKMVSDNPMLFDVIVEMPSADLNDDGTARTYLVYFVDTLEREPGDEIAYERVIKVGRYLYEESMDMVRTLPVYLSNSAIEYLQNR